MKQIIDCKLQPCKLADCRKTFPKFCMKVGNNCNNIVSDICKTIFTPPYSGLKNEIPESKCSFNYENLTRFFRPYCSFASPYISTSRGLKIFLQHHILQVNGNSLPNCCYMQGFAFFFMLSLLY